MNLLIKASKCPVLVLHFSCPSSIRAYINLSPPSLSISVLFVISLFSCNMVIGHKIFLTSMSKLHSSCYLPLAFQSNVACLSTGPLDTWYYMHWNNIFDWVVCLWHHYCCFDSFNCWLHYPLITWVMLCSIALSLSFIETALCESACLLLLILCNVTYIQER